MGESRSVRSQIWPPSGPCDRLARIAPLALALALLLLMGVPRLCRAQEAVSALPPAVTRSLYRSRWFEFLTAHLEDDARGASAALAEMQKTARAVGIHRLSDFSRTAVHEGRKAEGLGRAERARRAYAAAVDLDSANLDAWLSQISFLARQRAYAEAARKLPGLGASLLATQESRLAVYSSLTVWAACGFAVAVAALVLLLLLRHSSRIAHNLGTVAGRHLETRAALPLALLILMLPLAMGLGVFWAILLGGVLVFPFASKAERWVLGTALVLLGLLPQLTAMVARENIIERSPLYVAALDLDEQREDASAEDGLRQAAAVFSEDPDVWFLLGVYAERAGDAERAIASYDRAIQADPRDYRIFLNRGNVHFLEGDFVEAIRDYDAASQRSPRAPEVYYDLAIARGEAYDFDGQAAAMAKAREISESRVRGWAEHPTLARVVAAAYPLSRARHKIEEWNAQPKSRRLPGHAPPIRLPEALVSPLTMGCWAALFAAILWSGYLTPRGGLASECARCGKPFCWRCKKMGESPLYCSDCVRLYLRKEAAEIEVHVAQTREIRRRTRRRDLVCRLTSLVLPGAHPGLAGRPLICFLRLFLFLSLAAAAVIHLRLFDPRPLPPVHPTHVAVYLCAALAALLWLGAQREAWRESHGP